MGRNPGAGSAQQPEHRTLEGLILRALYAPHPLSDAESGGAPGRAPFVRGSRVERAPLCPWRIVALLPAGTPAEVNSAALEELAGGASGLQLPSGAAAWSDEELDVALRGVLLAGVSLHADGDGDAPALAVRLLARAAAQSARVDDWCLGADPLRSSAADCTTALRASDGTGARALLADVTPFHDAGAHAALDLALLLAATAHGLRALDAAGVAPERTLTSFAWRLPLERDFFGGVVKLRAARLAWSALASAAGLATISPPLLHAVGSRRTLTRRDAYTNLVRMTVQAAAAAIGGADAISLPAFDAVDGDGSAAGRRLARNVALVVEHEARLLDVVDPAGGSAHVEERTRELAEAAWEEFRALERAGGLAAALASGSLRARLDAEWGRRAARLASGEEVLVGVNLHPAPSPEMRNDSSPARRCGPWELPRRREEDPCAPEGVRA
jgi:methylmalonyl-CoA mutase